MGDPGDVDCAATTLAASASATFTLVVAVDSDVPDGATLSNTASVDSTTVDPDGANDSATETTAVIARADLSVTKSDSPDPVAGGPGR